MAEIFYSSLPCEEIERRLLAMPEIKVVEVSSDSAGLLTLPTVEGYTLVSVIGYSDDIPVNTARFGDKYYTGYYGSLSSPSVGSSVLLLFSLIANVSCKAFYLKIEEAT